jgi:hypothetical protein
MKINSYSCAPELRGNKGNGISRIGPHCHEMGHALGAMDFYDTDYNTGGNYEGTGRWDVMASGSWNEDGVCPANFNPYVKAYDFGWVNVQSMPAGQFVTLQPSTHVANQIFRMDSPVNGEYYLLENRQKDGIDSALPGEGLLIYHIHKDMEQALTNNTVNATHPQKCYIVCASSRYSVPATLAATYGNINSAGCPFPGNTAKNSFDDTTTPSAKCWNGVKSNLKLSNISLNGDHTITFYSGTEKNTTVWSESFENDDFMSQWEIIPAQTAIKWQRYTAVNNGNPTSIKDELTPSASDGDYYAGIKNKGFGLLHTNLLILPNLPLKDKVIYKLTFRYQNKAYMGSSGKLSVVYKTENANEWTNIHTYTELSSSWSEKELTLPGNPDEKIRLAFKAELSGGGIFIDDLQLLEIGNAMHALPITKEQTDCYYDFREQSVCLYSEKNTKAYVFDIAGKLWCNWILAAGKNYLKLPSGIYIISQQQQSVKVVVP